MFIVIFAVNKFVNLVAVAVIQAVNMLLVLKHQKKANIWHTILLVDDEPAILECVSELLQTFFNFDVIIARGGINALERYKTQWSEIDCVILDMIMPDMRGCEVYKRMKEINPKVKVIVMSGYCNNSEKAFMESCGCTYLHKPVDFDILNSTILETIGTTNEQDK